MRRQDGFTIIELLFAIVFCAIALITVTFIGFIGITAYKNGKACDFDVAKCMHRVYSPLIQEIKK